MFSRIGAMVSSDCDSLSIQVASSKTALALSRWCTGGGNRNFGKLNCQATLQSAMEIPDRLDINCRDSDVRPIVSFGSVGLKVECRNR